MYLNGNIVTLGGIGEVSTKEEYRNTGLAKLLLHKIIEYMREKNIIISALGTRNASILYEKFGFRSALYCYSIKNVTRNNTMQSRYTVMKLEDLHTSEYFKYFSHLYENYAKHFNGTIVRSIEYWKNWFIAETKDIWVILDNNIVLAYLSARVKDNELYVKEFVTEERFILQIHSQDGVFDKGNAKDME